jgi:hypothetical protein
MPKRIGMLPVFSPIGRRPPEISVIREFEFNDFCPVLGQKPGRRGAKDDVGEIEDTDPFEDLRFFIDGRRVKKFGCIGKIIFHSLSPQVSLFHQIALH